MRSNYIRLLIEGTRFGKIGTKFQLIQKKEITNEDRGISNYQGEGKYRGIFKFNEEMCFFVFDPDNIARLGGVELAELVDENDGKPSPSRQVIVKKGTC